MRKAHTNAMSSVEQYLRFGGQNSSVVINREPEQKDRSDSLSSQCERPSVEFRNANLNHLDAERNFFKVQKEMAQLVLDIENKLDDIVPEKNAELVQIVVRFLPFLRHARAQWTTRKVVSAGTGILRNLLKISDLYRPVREKVDELAQKYKDHSYWFNRERRLYRERNRYYNEYRRMGCPLKQLQTLVEGDERGR